MGLAGGIVRRVFSKSPCSSAAVRGGHSERNHVDHRRRWGSLRVYLCGDETSAAAEQEEDGDDDETVSVRSFETCVMPQETQAPVAAQRGDVNGGADSSNPQEPGDQGNLPVEDSSPPVPANGEEAATLIQSAFRGFMARRRLQEMKRGSEKECTVEPKSSASASITASVEVQVGESLSNLRLSDESSAAAAAAQHRASQKSRPHVYRAKEEWDDSTLSSNVLRMRIQSKIEATTRRERALAYAFSQQLRSGCGGGTKKRSARPEQGEFNVGWSWLERWMATRQAEPASAAADDCMSKNADSGGSVAGRRVIVVRRRHDVAVEEKESCGSNDVSAVSFDGSSGGGGGRSGLNCYRPGKNRPRAGRNLPRRKVASLDHRPQTRSHKVSKKVHQREEEQLQKDQAEAEAYDACQPPTDY